MPRKKTIKTEEKPLEAAPLPSSEEPVVPTVKPTVAPSASPVKAKA